MPTIEEMAAKGQAKLQRKAAGFDVTHVEHQFSANTVQVRVGRKPQLGEPSDPRANDKTVAVIRYLFGQHGNKLRTLGARSNERHLASQDVDQLR